MLLVESIKTYYLLNKKKCLFILIHTVTTQLKKKKIHMSVTVLLLL